MLCWYRAVIVGGIKISHIYMQTLGDCKITKNVDFTLEMMKINKKYYNFVYNDQMLAGIVLNK